MQLLRAFCTALLLDISAHDFFIPVPAYGTDARAFGPKCAPPRRVVTVGTRGKIARAVRPVILVTILVGLELGTDCTSKWPGSLSVPIARKAIAYRLAMSKQTSLRTVSTSASKRTRRYFAGHTLWYIKTETLCLLCR